MLARLSLRALHSWSEPPTRGEALLLMAKAASRMGDMPSALKIAEGLMANTEIPDSQSEVIEEARRLEAQWRTTAESDESEN